MGPFDLRSSEVAEPETSRPVGTPQEHVQTALGRMIADLALDSALVVRLFAPDRGQIVVSAGAPVEPAIVDAIGWPWVARAIRKSGVLVVGAPDGNTEVAADERRRLWAFGVATFVCIPLRDRDVEHGVIMLCSRHACRAWRPAIVPTLVSAAEAIRRVLDVAAGPVLAAPNESAEPGSDSAPAAALPAGQAVDVGMVGESPAWRYVMFRVDQVAATHATVLLLGETGTGKELVARAIHRRSSRVSSKFIALNCSALPTGLVESELFGRERGAFTGAHTSQPGRFELAHRGTLFLDEVADLPLELQPKLLRALQEGQLDRLGSSRTVDVDVRVIAATNRDLAEDVRHGRFRQDLYYRLNVFPITLPSLRDRREDIPLLATHIAARFGRLLRKPVKPIPQPVMRRLGEYDWPGNIREMENVIQRAIISSPDGEVSLNDISLSAARPASAQNGGTTLEAVEREHILHILAMTSWRIEGARGAAQLLGLKPSTLRSRLRKLGIQRGA